MKPLPFLLFLVAAWPMFASPAPIIDPGNLLTYDDYDFTLASGDLDLDLNSLNFPANTSIGPTDSLTIVVNFAAPVTFVLEPDYIHHDTITYSFDSLETIDGTFDSKKEGPFYGGAEISLDYDGSVVFAPPSQAASEGSLFYGNLGPTSFEQGFDTEYISNPIPVAFGPPLKITFNSAVIVFGETQNVTATNASIDVFGFVPDSASTWTLFGMGMATLSVLAKCFRRSV